MRMPSGVVKLSPWPQSRTRSNDRFITNYVHTTYTGMYIEGKYFEIVEETLYV
jgi:hypothetical protein